MAQLVNFRSFEDRVRLYPEISETGLKLLLKDVFEYKSIPQQLNIRKVILNLIASGYTKNEIF